MRKMRLYSKSNEIYKSKTSTCSLNILRRLILAGFKRNETGKRRFFILATIESLRDSRLLNKLLKSPQRVCYYVGALFSEECKTIMR